MIEIGQVSGPDLNTVHEHHRISVHPVDHLKKLGLSYGYHQTSVHSLAVARRGCFQVSRCKYKKAPAELPLGRNAPVSSPVSDSLPMSVGSGWMRWCAAARSSPVPSSASRLRPGSSTSLARAWPASRRTRRHDRLPQVQRRPRASRVTVTSRLGLARVVLHRWCVTAGRRAIPLIVALVAAIRRFRRSRVGLWREAAPAVVAIRLLCRQRVRWIRGPRWRHVSRSDRTATAVL